MGVFNKPYRLVNMFELYPYGPAERFGFNDFAIFVSHCSVRHVAVSNLRRPPERKESFCDTTFPYEVVDRFTFIKLVYRICRNHINDAPVQNLCSSGRVLPMALKRSEVSVSIIFAPSIQLHVTCISQRKVLVVCSYFKRDFLDHSSKGKRKRIYNQVDTPLLVLQHSLFLWHQSVLASPL